MRPLFIFTVFAAGLSACDDSPDRPGGTPGRDASTPNDAAIDAGAIADSGDTPDGGDAPDSGDRADSGEVSDIGDPVPPGALRTSYLRADSFTLGNTFASTLVGGFYDQNPSPQMLVEETIGPCEVGTYTRVEGGGFPTYRNMGTLMLTGGLEDASIPFGPGGYSPFSSDRALWNGGETLTFTSSDESFDVQLIAPMHAEMIEPFVAIGSDLAIPRSSDLQLVWSGGGTAGEVEISVDGPRSEDAPFVALLCNFPVAAGTGTIPAAALGRLSAGQGTISATVKTSAEAVVVNWGTIELSATSAVLGRGRWLHSTDLQ